MDEQIAKASMAKRAPDSQADDNLILYELDILLTPEQVLSREELPNTEDEDNPVPVELNTNIQPSRIWPDKRIPYKITPGVFNTKDIQEIMKAIDEWQKHTCIKIEPADSSDENYINFDDGPGCASHVGMLGGPQKVTLAANCRKKQIIIHEVGHAIGYNHEQGRPDRDDYVEIMMENIDKQRLYNFKKLFPEAFLNYTPYDYQSIMHYGNRYFSANGEITLRTIDPAYQDIIGTAKNLSFYDIKDANIRYDCADQCENKPICPEEAFVGKDCTCWCPVKGKKILSTCPSITTKRAKTTTPTTKRMKTTTTTKRTKSTPTTPKRKKITTTEIEPTASCELCSDASFWKMMQVYF
ncbi:blastula protease 10-like [Physella acuta]|uniref:blastula protease 10-like n=1 Tax=Physella acuta TaxID=109671 RepID=UPI0027DC0735|nr:blastula protease 10-like [Physella acuta]